MNHKSGFNALSRTSSHRRAMLRNMTTSLFRYERITTTKAKAQEVRKCAEKLITRAKVDSVHNRREAAKFIQDEIVLAKLFTNIGPRMKDRDGGYTRVLKLGFRQGDAADIVILELVDYQLDGDKKAKKADKADKAKKAAPKAKAESKSEAKSEDKAEKKPAAKKTTAKSSSSTAKKAPAKKAAAPKVEEKAEEPKAETATADAE